MTDNTPMPGTALPWAISYGFDLSGERIGPKRASYVAPADPPERIGIKLATPWIEGAWDDDPEAEANAAYIVWAANNAQALLSALEDLVGWLESNQRTIDGEFSMDELLEAARTAIATAGGRNG